MHFYVRVPGTHEAVTKLFSYKVARRPSSPTWGA